MPHTHSAEARSRRFHRAYCRGYITSTGSGRRWLNVSAAIFSELKVISESLERHFNDQLFTGRTHHFARAAAFDSFASGMTTKEQLVAASSLHRRANRAKHKPGLRPIVEPPARGIDLLSVNDPWCGARKPAAPTKRYCGDPWSNCKPRFYEQLPQAAAAVCCSADTSLFRQGEWNENQDWRQPLADTAATSFVAVSDNTNELNAKSVDQMPRDEETALEDSVLLEQRPLRDQLPYFALPSVGMPLRRPDVWLPPEDRPAVDANFNLCGDWRCSIGGTVYKIIDWRLLEDVDKHGEALVSISLDTAAKEYRPVYVPATGRIVWAYDEWWTRLPV